MIESMATPEVWDQELLEVGIDGRHLPLVLMFDATDVFLCLCALVTNRNCCQGMELLV